VLNDPSQAPAVYQQFTGKPGVYGVKYPGQQIKTMQSVIHILQWVFLSVAVVLLLSASVLILNTIRMAIFARRREVSVMKLVGATNWFIRLPFMAEGLIQGLLGAAVAVLVVLALYWGIGLDATKTAANQGNIIAQMSLGGWEVAGTCISGGGGRRGWSAWSDRPSPCAASSTSEPPPWPFWSPSKRVRWPSTSRPGPRARTVRHLLAHTSGLGSRTEARRWQRPGTTPYLFERRLHCMLAEMIEERSGIVLRATIWAEAVLDPLSHDRDHRSAPTDRRRERPAGQQAWWAP
jgi:hypothetical protein